MKITKLIEQLGGDEKAAQAANISLIHLRKLKSVGAEVEELANGTYKVIRKNSVTFVLTKTPNHIELNNKD